MSTTLRNALAELIGTFLFVFLIIAAVNNAGDFAPLAIGASLMVLVYATGHNSGGHLNPAVSLGALLRGAIDVTTFVAYIIAQFVGGVLAALVSAVYLPHGTPMEVEIGPSFLVEAIVTFVLVWVVLNSATSVDTKGNSFYGLAIGFVVGAGAFAVGSVSGGSFNPAVGLGLAVSGQFAWSALWMYIVAPLVGGAVAAGIFLVLNPHDRKPADA